MSNHTLTHASSAYGAKNRQPRSAEARPVGSVDLVVTRRGLTGLLALGVTLAAATGALGARTWRVGSGLGSALFPVEDIIELAVVAVGTVVAGWIGLHALVALACVVAQRAGRSWAAGERTVARHAPAVVRRLTRAAAGAGLGLALAAPTAMALPDRAAGSAHTEDAGPAVVLDLGWRPTTHLAAEQGVAGDKAAGRSAAPAPRPTSEQSSLVNRGTRTGGEREPLVVVEPGDTLWAIAAGGLAAEETGTDPSDAEIAAAVARWHQANREALGTNPDLIHPGTVLHRP